MAKAKKNSVKVPLQSFFLNKHYTKRKTATGTGKPSFPTRICMTKTTFIIKKMHNE